MKSSVKSMLDSSQPSQHQPFADSGGSPYARPGYSDPIKTWVDLMEIVEILCPTLAKPTGIGRDSIFALK